MAENLDFGGVVGDDSFTDDGEKFVGGVTLGEGVSRVGEDSLEEGTGETSLVEWEENGAEVGG